MPPERPAQARRPDVDVFLEERQDLEAPGVRDTLAQVAAWVKGRVQKARESGEPLTIKLPDHLELAMAMRAYAESLAARLKIRILCTEPAPTPRAALGRAGEEAEDAVVRMLLAQEDESVSGPTNPTLTEAAALDETVEQPAVAPVQSTADAARDILKRYKATLRPKK